MPAIFPTRWKTLIFNVSRSDVMIKTHWSHWYIERFRYSPVIRIYRGTFNFNLGCAIDAVMNGKLSDRRFTASISFYDISIDRDSRYPHLFSLIIQTYITIDVSRQISRRIPRMSRGFHALRTCVSSCDIIRVEMRETAPH